MRCRAAMLDALQKIGMRHRPSRQRWATEILKATRGEDLTRLKAYVDDGGVSTAECRFAGGEQQHVAFGTCIMRSSSCVHCPCGPLHGRSHFIWTA